MNKITQLRETVKSAFPPDNKEVLWIDVSDETNPIQKIYLRGEWKVLSGGGGGVAELMTETTWADLVALRDAGSLIAGMKYRIIDYETKTAKVGSQSAGHPFDIIVTALDGSILDEKASAIQSARDTDGYFANSKLEAWEVWCCLDNDTERFDWADAGNGKGVIYRMIDEWNNDVPYDFKNIAFGEELLIKASFVQHGSNFNGELQRDSENDTTIGSTPYYAWKAVNVVGPSISTIFYSTTEGLTLESVMYTISSDVATVSSAITLLAIAIVDITTFKDDLTGGSYNNIIRPYIYNGKNSINSIIFGNNCYNNTFGNNCYNNTFGNNCNYNTFGERCYDNAFEGSCNNNSFGNNCYSNAFGNYCTHNSFGNNCHSNTFDISCRFNTFGNSCSNNSFGDACESNSFGSGCDYNSFGDYHRYNRVDDDVTVTLNNSQTASRSQQVQNYHFTRGLPSGAIEVERSRDYQTTVAVDSSGNVKQFCLADIIV